MKIIHRFAIDATFIKLVIAIIPAVIHTTDFVVVLKAFAVVEAEVHPLEFKIYPELQISHSELLEILHFCQLDGVQLRIISFIIFWTGLDTPLMSELM